MIKISLLQLKTGEPTWRAMARWKTPLIGYFDRRMASCTLSRSSTAPETAVIEHPMDSSSENNDWLEPLTPDLLERNVR